MNTKKAIKGLNEKNLVTVVPKKTFLEMTKLRNESQVPTIFFNTCFDKNHLKTLIAWFLDQYGQKNTIALVETLKQVGFQQATNAGVSLGVDDLQIPYQKPTLLSQASVKITEATNSIQTGNVTSVEKSQALIDTWNQTSETLRQTAVQNFRVTNPVNPVYMMAFSGARGNISQVRQLVAMRGLMADPQGAILEFPIQSNFREGLTVTEYLISCFGARKGLVDTALRTATSGYLTRRLVDAVQHVVVHVTDCYTKKGIFLKGKNLEQRLIGRVLLKNLIIDGDRIIKKNTLVSPRLAKQILVNHKEILVRSPLTCQTEKSVCQLCYGMDLGQGKVVSLGEAVGIIAAQSIGEPGTQLTMRTFHTGGVGVFSEQSMTSFIAPFSGKIQFLQPVSGLFVRTPHGKIVYVVKQKKKKFRDSSVSNQEVSLLENQFSAQNLEEKAKILVRLISNKDHAAVYDIKLKEIPPGSLLWVRQGEYVKSGQLILQASYIETAKKEMPESIHPVRTPLSGQVFFEYMKLRKIEDQPVTPSKIKKQKLYEPIIPTLAKLGNFWIFSSFIQKETQISKSFFRKGDLISTTTPIQQYNLRIPYQGQLKKLESSLLFGNQPIQLDFSKIDYSGGCYFLSDIPTSHSNNTTKFQKNCNLLSYTKNSDSTFLNFYPFFKKSSLPYNTLLTSGYCTLLPFETQPLASKNLDTRFFNNPRSLIFAPHQLSKLNRGSYFGIQTTELFQTGNEPLNKRLEKPFSFLVNTNGRILSKRGVFQIGDSKSLVWRSKTKIQQRFRKNSFLSEKQALDQRQKVVSSQNKNSFNNRVSPSLFVTKGLSKIQKHLSTKGNTNLIEKSQGWFYIPQTCVSISTGSKMAAILIKPGKNFENNCFSNSYISLNFINSQNLLLLKSVEKNLLRDNFGQNYEFPSLEDHMAIDFIKQNINKISSTSQNRTSLGRGDQPLPKSFEFEKDTPKGSKVFCFYKKQNLTQNRSKMTTQEFELIKTKSEKVFRILIFKIKSKESVSQLIFFQKTVSEIVLLKSTNFELSKFLKHKGFLTGPRIEKVGKHQLFVSKFNSPIFNKQVRTFADSPQINVKLVFNSQTFTPSHSNWMSGIEFLKIQFQLIPPKKFHKIEQLTAVTEVNSGTQTPFPCLKIQFAQKVELENKQHFNFQTFENGWVVPSFPITRAFLKSKKLGEFHQVQRKNNFTYLNILRNQDFINLTLPVETQKNKNWEKISPFRNSERFGTVFPTKSFVGTKFGNTQDYETKKHQPTSIYVGTRIRWGQELVSGFASLVNGQIWKKTSNTLTVRKGVPLLASTNGLVHIEHNDLIQKKDLLITLRSRRLQTEDIVQGIPKIEQLFEARETQGGEILHGNMHIRLRAFFNRAQRIRPLPQAVEMSILFIQKFLVKEILQAYSNQGVQIAEKHVEVVVRQMTAKVRILNGGGTGLLPGELIQHRVIEKINHQLSKLDHKQATYEPVILGITKSVLQSESFLLAASFQQVSKVLVRSALANKTDFLRGLHENILVGQPIPAGTGILTKLQTNSRGSDRAQKSPNFGRGCQTGSSLDSQEVSNQE